MIDEDHKVADVVILAVSVDMMDDLAISEGSS